MTYYFPLDHARWTIPSSTRPDRDPPPSLVDFLDRRWRLPTCARTYAFHGVSTLGAVEPELADALRPLQGKFTVVNTSLVVPLPAAARRLAGRLLRAAWRHATRDRRPLALTLAEELSPRVRHSAAGPGANGEQGPEIRFAADLRYRLTFALDAPPGLNDKGDDEGDDRGAGPRARAADPFRVEECRVWSPIPWFELSVLVPDADSLSMMAPETRHLYRSVTGRCGSASHDRYWHVESWERFHEPGRMVGCIQPAAVEYAVARESGPRIPPPQPEDEGGFLHSASTGERSLWGAYSPAAQRRLFVPPGYCLIRFACWAELAMGVAA